MTNSWSSSAPVLSRRALAFEGRRVAITGGTGFIGQRLLRALAPVPGIELRALARSPSQFQPHDEPSIKIIEGSLEDPVALRRLCEGADFVFHLAGLTRAVNAAAFAEANADGVAALAEAAVGVAPKLQRFLLVSSLAAAGPPPRGEPSRNEAMMAAPVSDYGRSKLAGEERLKESIGELPWSIARPPAVYGPGERDLFEMFKMVSRGVAPRLGFRDQALSFVYADDLVESLLAIAVADATVAETLFCAHEEVRTDLELLEEIEAALGRRAAKPRLPFFLARIPAGISAVGQFFGRKPGLINPDRLRELAPSRWVCDPSRLAELTGYRCPTPLVLGVPLTAAWYRERKWL